MIRINPDDPKWTAYVLGELDESERAAIELELSSSQEAQALVEELRFAADLTKAEFQNGAAVTRLTSRQREAIISAASFSRPHRWFRARPAIWVTGFAVASLAAIVLTLALKPRLFPSRNEATLSAAMPVAKTQQPEQLQDSAL